MFARRKQPAFKYVLAMLDWLGIAWSVFIGVHFRWDGGIAFHRIVTIETLPEILLNMLFTGTALLILQSHGLYKINVALTGRNQAWRILKSVAYSSMLLAGVKLFFSYLGVFSANFLSSVYFLIMGTAVLIAIRVFIFRTLFFLLTVSGAHSRSLLLLGVAPTSRKLAANVTRGRWSWFKIAGFLDDDLPVGTDVHNGTRVLGRLNDVLRIVEERKIDEVIICLENVSITQLLELFELCGRTRAMVRVASSAYDVIPRRMFQESYGGVPVIGVRNFGSTSYLGIPNMKRVFDIVASAVGLLVHGPLLLMIAIAIKLDSRGPIFYKQIRVGKDGKPFKFYKFRSMTVGADKDAAREKKYASLINGTWTPTQGSNPTKIIDDSKITRVGRFIRKTSLDEFPQLFNVLKGDMSLVGPRPCLPYEWKHYEEWHKSRLSVTPGCTGMWQVLGRSQVGFHDMVILDLFYSQNISFHLDMWLMLKTIPVMVFGRGGK
jgi:undecaprenyl-phosphate galactose phosphotransferase